MNKNLLIGVGVLVVLVVGYMMFSNQQPASGPATTEQAANPSPKANEVTVVLSEQNDSGESGTATLTEMDGKVTVTVKTMGGPMGVSQPAHIHLGVCPAVGAVKYPLTNLMNGMSETTLDVTFAQLKVELPLGLNVHKSAPEASIYTSCGDLKF